MTTALLGPDTAALPSISLPPEWAPQRAVWTAWPANAAEWNGDLEAPRRDIAALVRALAPSNRVRLLVNGEDAETSARTATGGLAELVPARYGDIWLRDTGPVFAGTPDGPVALRFRTNGWGGKYVIPGDDSVGDEIAGHAGRPIVRFDFILEGGAVDHDGAGTVLATRQTLLNPNRNGWSETEAETALRRALGASKVIWLDEGLCGDHTDGHVDNLARFVGPARVVCQTPADGDPNAEVLEAAAARLREATDSLGRKLDVIHIPSPGPVSASAHAPTPASYMNFVIANDVVVVPTYGTATEATALNRLQSAFPGRTVVGLPSHGLLGGGDAGGGAFHCVTCNELAILGERTAP